MKKLTFWVIIPIALLFASSCTETSPGPGSSPYYGDASGGGGRPLYTLCLLSDKTPTIEARGGRATIAKAKEVFSSYIDPNFNRWGLDEPGSATKETNVRVYFLNDDWTNFSGAYNYLNKDLDRLCLTQSQVIYFCKNYPAKMIDPHYGSKGTFFLLKAKKEYFVAKVDRDADGLNISVLRFSNPMMWGCRNYLFVVPIS